MIISDTMHGLSPDSIYQMSYAYVDFQVLHTAVNHDIFTVLSKSSKSAGEIAQEIGTDPYITEKLLNTLVSVQLLIKDRGKYSNTPLSETYLIKGEPFYQGNYIKAARTISYGTSQYDDWTRIGEAIERGYEPPDTGDMFQLYDESFSSTMKEIAIRGEVQETGEIISGYSWFKDMKNLLDLGGTHGLYAIEFANRNPELKATLFDFPGVPELGYAKQHIDQYEMMGQIKIQEGDFVRGDIGSGYDMVFISHLYFPEVVFNGILNKINAALNENGRFIIKIAVIHKNRKGSPTTSLFELDMCFWGDEYHMFSIDEYVDLIEARGFRIENIAKIKDNSYGPRAILIFKKEALK